MPGNGPERRHVLHTTALAAMTALPDNRPMNEKSIACGIDPRARAETLSPAQFVALAETYARQRA